MLRALLLSAALLALSLSLAACGATPASPSTTPGSGSAAAAAETPAEACLRTASAKHEKRVDEPKRISAKHVLVKFYGAKGAQSAIGGSHEEACLRAIEVRDKIRGGADFSKVMIEYSEEHAARDDLRRMHAALGRGFALENLERAGGEK
jgi:peptidyl-prolyl cis-trans isomerase NIMA-interacting 1